MDRAFQAVLDRVQQKRCEPSKPSGTRKLPGGSEERLETWEEFQARQKRKEYLEKIERSGIHRRFQGITFDAIEARGLPDNPTIRENYAQVKDYAAHLKENIQDGIGLIFTGSYGTMKTTMAVAVLRKHIDDGGGGLMIPMCSLIDNLYSLRTLNREEEARFEERIRKTPLLVLDDLGGENTQQGWVLAKVDSIITERYNRMLPVIVTTNLTQEELGETYSGRIVDRLKSTSKLLAFSGKSERGVWK